MAARTIISTNIRLRHPESLTVGEGSIVDDFCYFSTRVTVGKFSHIASGCTIAGGDRYQFSLGDFSSVSSGVRIWCGSDDFVNDIVTIIPEGMAPVKENFIGGDVIFDRLTAVGANAVIMPGNHLPEGAVIGALSFVPAGFDLQPWTVYAGTPVRAVKPRNRESVLRELDAFESELRRMRGD